MKKVIYQKTYHGFEEIYDLNRDIEEALDSRFNEEVASLPGEFSGKVKVTIEYDGDDLIEETKKYKENSSTLFVGGKL